MKGRTLCIVALGVWVATLAAGGWMFFKGWTAAGSDGRTAIVLAPAERDQILAEMRQFLKAVQGVVSGLGDQNPAQAGESGATRRSAHGGGCRSGAHTEIAAGLQADGHVDSPRYG